MASKGKSLQRVFDNWPIKILSLAVAVVIVLFNDLAGVDERFFSIPLTLQLAEGVVPGAEYISRVRITIRGDSDSIFQIIENDIVAYADFTSHTVDGQFRAPVEIAKIGTAIDIEALEISVEPADVVVILEQEALRSVELTPNLVGFPPPGYELSDYRITPTTVQINGPRSRVDVISSLLTEEIPLSERREDFSESVRLIRPDPLIGFPGGDIVEFRALITESVIQTSFESVEITVLDLAPEFRIVGTIPDGTMRVQGKQLDLEGIPETRIRIVIDASGISEPGEYELATRPQVPGGVLVLGIDPARIELTVVEREAQ